MYKCVSFLCVGFSTERLAGWPDSCQQQHQSPETKEKVHKDWKIQPSSVCKVTVFLQLSARLLEKIMDIKYRVFIHQLKNIH